VPDNIYKYIESYASKEPLPKELKSFIIKAEKNNGILSIYDIHEARRALNRLKHGVVNEKISGKTMSHIRDAIREDQKGYFDALDNPKGKNFEKYLKFLA
jgi:hypothetical protein